MQDLAGKQLGVWMMGREFNPGEKVLVVGKGGTMKEYGGVQVAKEVGEGAKVDEERTAGKIE